MSDYDSDSVSWTAWFSENFAFGPYYGFVESLRVAEALLHDFCYNTYTTFRVARTVRGFGTSNPLVETMLLLSFIFTSVWQAFLDPGSRFYEEVNILGCMFHWVQAVWRKVANLSLKPMYNRNGHGAQYIRRLLLLPFPLHHKIAAQFDRLADMPEVRI